MLRMPDEKAAQLQVSLGRIDIMRQGLRNAQVPPFDAVLVLDLSVAFKQCLGVGRDSRNAR